MATEVPRTFNPSANYSQLKLSTTNSKIISFEQAKNTNKETIVLCHGHFNIIHPGHIRYLDYARQHGTKLVVTVIGDDALLMDSDQKTHFKEIDRAVGVAAIQAVDQVILLRQRTLKDAVKQLKPDFLILGKEFEHEIYDQVQEAVELVQLQRGEVLYHAGKQNYAFTELLRESQPDIIEQRNQLFLDACNKQGFCANDLIEPIKNFGEASLLVIGDTIVDRYVACDALGMSAEAPIIVAQELKSRDYVGGAAIVALHAKALGARCNYISVVGCDQNAELITDELDRWNVGNVLIEDTTRPTTLKIRYMVENQKIFRVSRLNNHGITKNVEEKVISEIRKQAHLAGGILVSDFVYGVITPRVIEVIKEQATQHHLKIFGDLQCSTQVGNVSKFKNFHLLCPTEREARMALDVKDEGIEWVAKNLMEKTETKNLIMKLGSEGFIAYGTEKNGFISRQHFPALNPNPFDLTGAGDSLFAALAVGICSNTPLMQSSALGACMAAQAVQTVGNVPVSKQRLQKQLLHITSNLN